MSQTEFNELIGYAASLFIVTSLLMGNMMYLRIVNCIGCALFVAYGLYIDAYPVIFLNATSALINIYHLYKLRKKHNNIAPSIN